MPTQADPRREVLSGLPQPGDVLGGKYRLVRTIGIGGMGAVLEGVHLGLGERVAVKFLLPSLLANEEALARFERESKALVAVKSEHVARVFDVGTDAARPYMVMEFLEGRDLGEILAEGGALDVRQAVGHLLQALEAIAEAHALGIVHRDLKPENLFVTLRRDGSSSVKVLDFGLSKMVRVAATPGGRPRALTMDDKTLGTPNYMSPEQWMSAKDVGPATDQWALGAILYELLAGRAAFGGKQVGEVCGKVLNAEPVPLGTLRPEVPARLAAAVHRTLAKDPRRRFPSVVELAAALEPFGPTHAALSVARISGVLQRPAAARPGRPAESSVGDEPSADAQPELDARTQRRLERPVAAADHFASTPSWQAAARPLSEARRRRNRSVIVVTVTLGVGALGLVGLGLRGGPEQAPEPDAAAPGVSAEPIPAAGAPSDAPTEAPVGTDSTRVDAGHATPGEGSAQPNASPSAPVPSSTPTGRPPVGKPRPKEPSIFDQRW